MFNIESIKFKPYPKEILVFLGLILIAFITFYPSLLNLNFFWDDERFIFSNPSVLNAPHWYSFWLRGDSFYKSWPLGYSVFWSLIKLFPTQGILFYKSLNIFFHAINGYLVYHIIKKLKFASPFFLALFFLIHPLHVETVSWIFQFLVILSFTFYLISIIAIMKFCESNRKGLLFFALGFFLFSIWTKSITLFGPLFFTVLFGVYSQPLRRYFLLTPFFILSLTLGLMNVRGTDALFSQKNSSFTIKQNYQDNISLTQSSLSKNEINKDMQTYLDYTYNRPELGQDLDLFEYDGVKVFRQASWHYINKLFFPINLKFIYPIKSISVYSSIIIVAMIFLLPTYYYYETSDKTYLFIIGLALTSLVPFLGMSKIAFFYWSYVADHYAYGLVLILPFLIGLILEKFYSKLLRRGLLLYMMILFLLNLNHGFKFNNPTTLYTEAVIDKPHPAFYSLLFQEYLYKFDIKNAEKVLKIGLTKFPDDVALKDDAVRLNALKASL